MQTIMYVYVQARVFLYYNSFYDKFLAIPRPPPPVPAHKCRVKNTIMDVLTSTVLLASIGLRLSPSNNPIVLGLFLGLAGLKLCTLIICTLQCMVYLFNTH